jgi:hypothetical protein
MDAALQRAVWDRAQATCEYCRMPQDFDRAPFEIDHVIPEKHGGLTILENLALSCFFCNRYKGPNLAGLDPTSGLLTPLFDPRRDSWADHFRWDGSVLAGKTPRGRTTIVVLRINDLPRIVHRNILIENREFPRQ